MTHEDSSTPEDDAADAQEAIDDASTTESKSSTTDAGAVSRTAGESDEDVDAAAEAADDSPAEKDPAEKDLAEKTDGEDADGEKTETEKAETEKAGAEKAVPVDDEPSARHPLASLVLAVSVAALIAAVVCVGYFGYTGIRAYTVDATATQLRDESVEVAQQAVLNITAVDPNDIAGWEKRLKSSLTGDALSQVKPDDLKKLVAQGQAAGNQAGKIESKIARSAVTALDTDEDTATVLVFANVTATNKNQPVQQSQMGFLLTIVDADGTRKANKVVALNPLEYSQNGAGVSTAPGDGTTPTEGGN